MGIGPGVAACGAEVMRRPPGTSLRRHITSGRNQRSSLPQREMSGVAAPGCGCTWFSFTGSHRKLWLAGPKSIRRQKLAGIFLPDNAAATFCTFRSLFTFESTSFRLTFKHHYSLVACCCWRCLSAV
ncbi:hypothetical protein E2C01_016689 [Portunus trituberculatus]|uniref:Uncharacterized protein n=1 Tax=Portunus trituberculatus TaxID=210409 RepID=A0A5B7DQ50_PORTR|nr:hypothetical protein [Portunus trituberculatus]